ncbi:MAG: bifunctional 4-hydroxy-2-oxoglutarate aldolase/2-dehydro-3-deoxy-phosphogluconate aldolase [Candidatus Dormibacteraceae bacterium]
MPAVEGLFPTRLCGVIRTDNPEVAFRACLAAIEAGIGTVEVTTSVPSCFDIVRGLLASTGGGVPIGVGTVWEPEAVRQAKEAGARFVVTPVILPEVADACREHGIVCVMGALTPTEIHQARLLGADIVKVFPVAPAGGPAYLRQLGGPMPGIPLWVSGGVEVEDVEAYLGLGVRAVGLTTAVFPPDALSRRDWGAVRQRARRALAAAGVSSPVGA